MAFRWLAISRRKRLSVAAQPIASINKQGNYVLGSWKGPEDGKFSLVDSHSKNKVHIKDLMKYTAICKACIS